MLHNPIVSLPRRRYHLHSFHSLESPDGWHAVWFRWRQTPHKPIGSEMGSHRLLCLVSNAGAHHICNQTYTLVCFTPLCHTDVGHPTEFPPHKPDAGSTTTGCNRRGAGRRVAYMNLVAILVGGSAPPQAGPAAALLEIAKRPAPPSGQLIGTRRFTKCNYGYTA